MLGGSDRDNYRGEKFILSESLYFIEWVPVFRLPMRVSLGGKLEHGDVYHSENQQKGKDKPKHRGRRVLGMDVH